MKEIEIFEYENNSPLRKWINSIDKAYKRRVVTRLQRLEDENYYGDFKAIDDELSELRFHFGSGYRIYYHESKNTIILLISGGDKSTQKKDIQKAKEYLKIWKGQNNGKKI